MLKSLIEKLQRLYQKGKCSEALEEIASKYPSLDTMPVEIKEIKAWCHFRKEEYTQASEAALSAGSTNADELLAQLAAYVSKDDAMIMNIHRKLPDNPGVCNALAIRARDKDSTIPMELIVKTALKLVSDNRIAAVNLINNTARLLIAKGNGSSDAVMAIGFWQIALLKYGDVNYHHRAAVYFHLSKAYENLKAMDLAIKSAEESLTLWQKQAAFDPSNPKFLRDCEGAKKRLEELKALISAPKK